MALGWDLSLSPHALLISLTPAGEAFANRGEEGGPVTSPPWAFPPALSLPRLAAGGCDRVCLLQPLV